jgi:3-dehydroquinate synthetase
MGAGKTTVGEEVARRLGLPFLDSDAELESSTGLTIAEHFAEGEQRFRRLEEQLIADEVLNGPPAVLALGGGAVLSETTRRALRHAFTVLLDVDVEDAWARVGGGERPLAQSEERFRELYDARAPVYDEVADAVATDADGVVLELGGVVVEEGALGRLGQLVPGEGPAALVTEPRVGAIHGDVARTALGDRLAESHELPSGEDAKQAAAIEGLWRALRIRREATVVALGGGALTDAAGFAAATYLRGVAWASVPSTLTGQVDAGIGGKTGIDIAEGKNLVGSFHWPARTVVDPLLLTTLPEQVRADGMAEVVKTGLLAGEPLWDLPDAELVRRCAAYKTALCLRDPYDTGARLELNLGHTFAHALEAASGYELRHGQAVALGLLAALRLSGIDTAPVDETLAPEPVRVDRELAWEALRRDKKSGRVVLLERPGAAVVTEVAGRELRAALDALIAD